VFRVDNNTMLMLMLRIFQHDGEKFCKVQGLVYLETVIPQLLDYKCFW